MSSPLLSRKQLWRNQRHTNRFKEDRNIYYQENANSDESLYSKLAKVLSESSIASYGTMIVENHYYTRGWMTTGDLMDGNNVLPIKKRKQKPKIRFYDQVHAVLIPSRSDYDEMGLKNCLWWSSKDYEIFQHSAHDSDFRESSEDIEG